MYVKATLLRALRSMMMAPSRSAAAAACCFYSLLLLLPVDGRPTPLIPIEKAAAQQQQHQHHSSRPSLLQSTCNSTTYYDLCIAALAADPSSSTADVRGLCAIAVSAAAANASATASELLANATAAPPAATVASTTSDSGQGQLLLRTCAAKYADAREALLAARDSIAEEAYDYASVHVSAAAEYPAVCRALFRRQKAAYPAELARREEGLEHLCTIALDIISLLG